MKLHFTKTTEKFTIRLNVEADCMKLFMDVEPVAEAVITRNDILEVLKETVDVERVDLRVVDDVVTYLNRGEAVEDRRIIKGTPAVDGANGKLLLLKKKFSGEVEVAIDQRGYADFQQLHLYDNIAKGDIVGRIYPPKKGTDGLNVFSKTVPAKPGKPVKVLVDKTISIAPDPTHDYQILQAEGEGYLTDTTGRLSIGSDLVVSGDLDLSFGSIDFIGNLRVAGDVAQGLTLNAKKGVYVQGSLTGATLISTEGDISVKGYYYGGPRSKVECFKTFSANVVHSVNAETGGDIIIAREAVDCSLRTHTSILMLKGQLVGGLAAVTRGVEAKYIGNEVGQKTVIRLCSDVEITTEYVKLEKNLESHDKAIQLLELRLGPYAENQQRIELLNPDQRSRMKDFAAKLRAVAGSKDELSKKKSTMLEGARMNDVVRVNFLSKMYRGVVVMAGESVFAPTEDLNGPASLDYIAAEKSFALGELKPLAG